MWEKCGVVRETGEMNDGINSINEIEKSLDSVESRPDIAGFDDLAHFFDLQAMVASSKATLLAALERKESRGAHQRSDYVDLLEKEKKTILVNLNWSVTREEIPKAREEVISLASAGEVSSDKLLEQDVSNMFFSQFFLKGLISFLLICYNLTIKFSTESKFNV